MVDGYLLVANLYENISSEGMCIYASHSTKNSNDDPVLLGPRLLLPGYGNSLLRYVVTVY
jgi:hypothetical protein